MNQQNSCDPIPQQMLHGNAIKEVEIDFDDSILEFRARLRKIEKSLVTLLLAEKTMTPLQKERLRGFDRRVQEECRHVNNLWHELARNHSGRADLFR